METAITPTEEPSILTASVYFWSSAGNASTRRRNEARRIGEVADWFRSLGMAVRETADGCTGAVGAIRAEFRYSESCRNVYRHLAVTVAGKRSNLTTLRKLADPATRAGTLAKATRRANVAAAKATAQALAS